MNQGPIDKSVSGGATALVYEGAEQVGLREFTLPTVGFEEMLVDGLPDRRRRLRHPHAAG